MSDWRELERELDAWAAAGRPATFWWRDDDASAATPALERLLDLGARADVPVALAVVPAAATDDLGALVHASPHATLLQHGYAHQNHAGPDEKKIELGPHRPAEHVVAEIATGWQRLEQLCRGEGIGERLLPVLVPPWNRIAPRLVLMLPEIRFAGLSAWGARRAAEAAPGLRVVNVHVDVMQWKGRRGFAGTAPSLAAAVAHLAARRSGQADADEPTGLLTHHMAHDGAAWAFIAEFVARTRAHAGARWLSPRQAFGWAA